MWPFKKKMELYPVPTPTVADQLKSISLPQSIPKWNLSARGRTDWSVETAILEGYNASAIVYACVEKRAKLIASVPWKVYTKNADGELEAAPDSQVQKLIDRPNPAQSFYEIMYNVSQSLDLAGQAFVSKIVAGTREETQELWYLPPKGMKIAKGPVRLIEQFVYGKTPVVPEEMIMFRMPNPNDPIFGMPVLMAAGRATDIDRESGIWQKVSLENRGAADVNIKLPENATQEQLEQVKKTYADQQTGPKNARKALITNADIQTMGQTAVELDFVASRRAIWTEICAVFGMSLSNLGMTEAVNLANAEAMDKQLWQNTIIPQLVLIEKQLNHQLLGKNDAGHILRPDLSGIEALQANLTELYDNARKLFDMGVPFDQINQKLELGLDEFDGSNVGYLQSSLIPASFNQGLEGDDDENIGDDGNVIPPGESVQAQALNGAQISSILSIVQEVALGQMPLESAIALVMVSIPSLNDAQARELLAPAAAFTPATPDA
ncbi:MAG: phage portal protein [Planctomycetes bacterium]|nr:phage portal protein [Planctomycetota bacterium]